MAQNKTSVSVFNGLAPAELPKLLNWDIDFSGSATQSIDLLAENTNGQFQYAQTVYVDNSRNPAPVLLVVGVSGQRILVAPGTQEIVPLFSPDQTQVTAVSTVAFGARTLVHFLNVPLPTASWSGIAPGAQAPLAAGINRSGNIAVGGTAQPMAAANPNRLSLTGQNISATDMGINEIGGTALIGAAGTYTIAPGECFAIATNRAVSVVNGTGGAAWTATET